MLDDKKKDLFEIDLSELEKIKNEKPNKKNFEKEGYDLLSGNNQNHEYIEDEYFIHNIENEINSFNKVLSASEIKIVKNILKIHRKNQQVIFLAHKQINKTPVQQEIKEIDSGENINDLIAGFNEKLNRPKQSRTTFVSKSKKQNIAPNIITNNLDKLLNTETKCIWLPHAELRLKERVDQNYSQDLKTEIEKYLNQVYELNHLNFDQEYELHYRTENVHTFKVVCFKSGKFIFIKTLYRIDKESKKTYIEEKEKYKK